MFMWFSNGSMIPPGISPLPQNQRLGYIQRLKEESAKLLLTETPVYLIYMGRLLNSEQKILLESLQNEIPNLAVIDYDEVEKNISDQRIVTKVERLQSTYKKQQLLTVGEGGIANLVDFTRLVLIYNSHILRAIAQTKITIPLKWCEGLIYRDFDVTLERETMTDIPTTLGYIATLNLQRQTDEHYTHLTQSAKNQEELRKIADFFNRYLYNLEMYHTILPLFSNKSLNTEENTLKETLLSQFKKICSKAFDAIFIFSIFIENSFLAVNQDQHQPVNQMIESVLLGDSPYRAVQSSFHHDLGKHFTLCLLKLHKTDLISEFLIPQQFGFKVGNDFTWKMTVKEQHTQIVTCTRSTIASATMPMRFTNQMNPLNTSSNKAWDTQKLDVNAAEADSSQFSNHFA